MLTDLPASRLFHSSCSHPACRGGGPGTQPQCTDCSFSWKKFLLVWSDTFSSVPRAGQGRCGVMTVPGS